MLCNAALGFFDDLQRCTTAAAVLDAMRKAVTDFGIDQFCLNVFPNSGQRFDEVVLVNRLPPGWMELYLRKNYILHDPSQRYARRTVHPYEWKDAPYDRDREPKTREFLQRANDFAVDNALVVPVPRPTGCVGQVFMGGRNWRLSMRDKPSLHLMALCAFDRVERLSGLRMFTPVLTRREREVLTWTAAGKTAWEIGEILHIAKRTVDAHLQTAAHKLQTFNKTQTVAVAMREKLIEL